jgi:opacity protein-like surface antigen
MKLVTLTLASVLSLLFVASPLFAQPRWTAEVRGGVNVAVDEFAGVDLETGAGLELGLGVRVAPDLFVYGAWDWQTRAAKTPLFGTTADVEDTGYAFGLQYLAPLSSRAKPWVRAGGLFNHVEIEDEEAGDLVADSKHTFGFEAGGGLDVTLNDRWSVTPGVRYRRFEPTVRFGGAESSSTLAYLTFDVGIALKF